MSDRARVREMIEGLAQDLVDAVDAGELPELTIPSRTLANVRYDQRLGHFVIGSKAKHRGLGVRTARAFAQTMKLLALSKELVDSDEFATKREAYYVAKTWGDCRFEQQSASDAILDDVEALAARSGVTREALGFFPESHGGSVAGALTIIDESPDGDEIRIDLRRLGRGAYTVPRDPAPLRFESDAELVLVIETGGMFQRLATHRFWERLPCILVEMGGVPTRATRRFVGQLNERLHLPIYCFTDCDPYGFANIYRTLKAGSGNAAHTGGTYAVPEAHFLGVTPDDIVEFGLEDATHPLEPVDVKRAEDALANDPFFRAHPRWVAAIERMLTMGVRAEQQALAKWGLNYVIEEYLPRKLSHPELFLP